MGERSSGAPIKVVGLDHHRTPVAIRERLAISQDACPAVLRDLLQRPGVEEAVLISTCNRVEVHFAGAANPLEVADFLAEREGVEVAELRQHCFQFEGEQAVSHLFRVISSLESLVLGEYQIVHQVKNAYLTASDHGTTGSALDPLFQRALAVAADVRNRTGIGAHKVSVASIGVDLAKQIHGDLSRSRLLVVGAGEIAELSLVHLVEAGLKEVTIINRTQERALDLAALPAVAALRPRVLTWDHLVKAMGQHDIVITSTAAKRPIIGEDEVRRARRGAFGPLMLIDLAVPRDVDARVGQMVDTFLYNMDHLDKVVADNMQLRDDEVAQAEAVVAESVKEFRGATAVSQSGVPASLVRFFAQLVEEEAKRTVNKLDPEAAEENRQSLRRLANKVQHRLMGLARDRHEDPAVKELFRRFLN